MPNFGGQIRRFHALEEDYDLDIQRLCGVIDEMRKSVDLLARAMSQYEFLSDQNADPATAFECFRDICCYRLEISELYCTFLAVQPRTQAAFEALKEQEKKVRQAARSRRDQRWRSVTVDTCAPPRIPADVERIAERFRHYTDEMHDLDIQAWAGNHKVPLAMAVLRGQANFDDWTNYGLAQFWSSVCANPSRFVKEYAGRRWPKASADWSTANRCSERETSRSNNTGNHRNEYETCIRRGFNKTGVETYEVEVIYHLSEDCSVGEPECIYLEPKSSRTRSFEGKYEYRELQNNVTFSRGHGYEEPVYEYRDPSDADKSNGGYSLREPEYIYLEPKDIRAGSSKLEYEYQEPQSSRGRFGRPKVEYFEPRRSSSSRGSSGFEEVEYEYGEPRSSRTGSFGFEYEYIEPRATDSSSRERKSGTPEYEYRKSQHARSSDNSKSSKEPDYEHQRPQKSRSNLDKPDSSRHREPKPSKNSTDVTTTMAEKWRSEYQLLLKGEGSKIKSKFPEPPQFICSEIGCNDRASSRAIPQCCEHGLEKLFGKMNGLDAKRERVYWHPDRWSTAPAGKVDEYKAKAGEVFVVLNKMAETA